MNTKTNNINSLENSLDTTRKTLPKAIKTALDSYKDSINNTLNNNLDETLKVYKTDYINSVNSILDIDDDLREENNLLTTFKNLGFHIDEKGFHNMQEKENREPLTLAGVMDSAEDFFKIKSVA